MSTRKKCLSAFLIVIAALCLFAMHFVPERAETVYATNSKNYKGTYTDDEWNGTQTTNNLITIGGDDTAHDGWYLSQLGWHNLGNAIQHSRHYTHSEVDLDTAEYGWGIQAETFKDLGDKNYENGLWYKITLSETDRIKADKGDLTVSASALYYRNSVAITTAVSLKLFFYNDSDTDLGSKIVQQNIKKSAYKLEISDFQVPANTAWIKYYVSNYNNNSARPYIGGMTCTLTDKTAPKAEKISMDKGSIKDVTNNIAIPGNSIKYYVEFDEKVSVSSYGTAKLGLNGTDGGVSNKKATLITENGKSKVCYTFSLRETELKSSGTISLYSVSGLTVNDEAGNSYTYNVTSPTADTVQYYKKMRISTQVKNLSVKYLSNNGYAYYGTYATGTLAPEAGYELPASIEITVDGKTLASGKDYTYKGKNAAEPGTIIIHGDVIKGDIVIKATGTPKKVMVSFDKQYGSNGTSSITAIYKETMPNITAPTRTGYTFQGYYSEKNGQGTKYYDALGNNLRYCDFYERTTLYAYWKANPYEVNYDANKPETASGSVKGSTGKSNHTYGTESPLSENKYTLEGWTFTGWATTPKGSVSYADGANVTKLTTELNGKVTLYAVWKANTYTVEYDGNKPGTTKNNVTGTTSDSTHTYDSLSALSTNKYALEGYTFSGWATTKIGAVIYKDGEKVTNLTADAGGKVTLYAVWKANTYTVKYNGNKPGTTKNNVTGTTTDSSHTYDSLSALSTNKYALEGYTFSGWATTPSGAVIYKDGEKVTNLTAEAGGTVTFYAVWKANNYTVKYDGNKPGTASAEVTGSTANSNFTYDDEYGVLSANGYSLTGWSFSGWAAIPDGEIIYKDGAVAKNLTAEAGGIFTLYAVWQENEYTLSFNTDGGNFVNSVRVKYDNSLPSVTPPTRKGYNFKGYFSERNGAGVKYYDEKGEATGVKYNVDGDTTLYASWTAIKYSIELYNMGVYVDVIPEVYYGLMLLPSAETLNLERANYTFVGWNLYDDQNWSMYLADTEYKTGLASKEGEVIVLYAAWLEKPVYTISFDANGGAGAPAMAQAHEDETIYLSAVVPARADFTFLGWATDSSASVAEYRVGDKFTMGSEVVTLYAVWKLNPSLTYDLNGGSYDKLLSVLYPAPGKKVIISSVVPKLTGHVFKGWSTNGEKPDVIYTAGEEFIMPDTNTVLYAVWQKETYTVKTVAHEGYSFVGLNSTYSFGDVVTFTVTGTKPNVYINGQFLTADESKTYSFKITGNTTVFVADGSKISLIYSANGGDDAPYDNSAYESYSTASISDVQPTRTGYSFEGWATDKNATDAEYVAGSSFAFNGDSVILYAVWKANTYKISYNANGASGTMSSDTLSFDENGMLTKNSFEKEGHTFIGWALSANGEVVYSDGADVKNLCTQNGDSITLYAVWEQTITKITFASDDETELDAPVSIAYGAQINSLSGLVVPVRAGYRFKGYTTQKDGKGEMIFDEQLKAVYAGNSGNWDKNVQALTLYANWDPISYTIVYVNGQTKLGTQFVKFDQIFELLSFSITAPDGYHFAGWSTLPSGQVVAYTDKQEITNALTQTEGEEVYLYAVFSVNEKFSIIYNANGGSNAPVDSTTYISGDTVQIITDVIPTREGYIFGGWSFDPNSGVIDFVYESGAFKTTSVKMADGGITLYAVWTSTPGTTLPELIKKLQDDATDLSNKISGLENSGTDFSSRLADLETAIESAQNDIVAIKALGNTYATHEELQALETKLTGLLQEAENRLQLQINTIKTDLESTTSKLEGYITSNDVNISGLQTKLSDLQTKYDNAKAIIDSNVIKIGSLESSVNSLKGELTATETRLQAQINTIKTDLTTTTDDLNNYITSNNTNISDLQTKLSDLQTKYDNAKAIIDSNVIKIGSLESNVNSLKGELTATETRLKAQIDAIKADLTTTTDDLNNYITSNNTNISGLQTKLSDLQTKYDEAKAIIDSNVTKIASLESSVNSLKSELAATEDRLQKQINTIKTDLESTTSKLEGYITSNDTSITEINAAIKALQETTKNADTIINSNISRIKALASRLTLLEQARKNADESLQEQIDAINETLKTKIAEFTKGIADNKTSIETINNTIKEMQKAYAAAKLLIDSNITDIASLTERVAALTQTCKETDESLQEQINDLNTKLTNAISDLNKSIKNNKANLEAQLDTIKKAYEAADKLINADLTALKAKDAELKKGIDALKASCKATDDSLQQAIDAVQENLDKAISDLNSSISANKDDIESKLSALEKACDFANALINADLTALKAKDAELESSISALQTAYKAADEALLAGIKQVQDNLDALKRQLEQKDAELENKLDSLRAESEKNALICMIINIVLGVAIVALAVVLVVNVIKRKSQGKRS